ncbi:MAG: hypothetical protein ACR2K3_12660 [Nocardioides sp.]
MFWVGPDHAVGSQWWDDAPKCNWGDHQPFAVTPPGAAAGAGIAAVGRQPGHLDVFWVRPDGGIGSHWWDGAPGCNWGDHQPFEVAAPASARTLSPLGLVSRTPDHLDVFWITPDGAIASNWWDAAPGSSWGDHRQFLAAAP